MKQIEKAIHPNDIVFVMSATDGQAVQQQARNFKAKVAVGSVIVTKLDCHTKGGGALSAVAATHSPIVFIGTGQHYMDFELFKPENFVQKMLGMGDISTLLDTMKDANIDSNSQVYKRIQDGRFTLRDFYEIMQSWQKIGSMSKVIEMMPGMQSFAQAFGEQGDIAAKSYLRMMDSMTSTELDDDKVKKLMTPSRIHRVARGSGYSIVQVATLITMFVKLEEIIKKFGKSNFKQMMQDPGSMMNGRMNQQQLGQLSKMINPNVLKQMGGLGGLQSMMRQMQGGGMGAGDGLPSMGGLPMGLPGMMGGGGGAGGAGGGFDLASMMNKMKNLQKGRK